jgi:hypothetical protein
VLSVEARLDVQCRLLAERDYILRSIRTVVRSTTLRAGSHLLHKGKQIFGPTSGHIETHACVLSFKLFVDFTIGPGDGGS